MFLTRVLSGLLLICCCQIDFARGSDREPDVRVMSFNIRYGTANDGDNHWKDFTRSSHLLH